MLQLNRTLVTLLALLIGASGVAVVLYAWRLPPFTSAVQVTDNAYVRGQVTVIAPQLAGYVAEVAVQDYETVKRGQLLVRIDDRIYRQKLDQAKAALSGAEAALANSEQTRAGGEAQVRAGEAQVAGAQAAAKTAEAAWDRIAPLLQRGVVTQSDADQARAALEQARAALGQTQAQLDVSRQSLQATVVGRASLEASVEGARAAVQLAEIDLSNTRIAAPEDGRLGEVGARLGQYVAAGTQLLAIVPARVWVVANFKETQLAGMEAGQPVSFTVDALRHARLTGHIERFAPAAGSEFSVLRPDNATGNFTKVAQRVAVRIGIDPGQPLADRLVPGLSVVASVDTSVGAQAAE